MSTDRHTAPGVPRRSVPVPTGWLALVVVALVVPLAVVRASDWTLAVVLIGLVAVVVAVDVILAVHPRSIEVAREFPDTVPVGEQTTLTWIATSRAERPTRVEIVDSLWPSFAASRSGSRFVLAAGGRHRFGARITPSRRGRFPFGALTVRTEGPLRLVRRQQTRQLGDTLAVLPAHPSRDLVRARLRIPLESGLRSVRTRGTGTDFDQLREYRPGDEFRRVDWAATARQHKPIVREYRAERNQHVVALLDNGRLMAGTVGDAPRVEHAMDAILGLTRVASHLGDNVGLVTFDQQVRSIVPPSSGRSQFGRVAEAMYLLDTSYAESAYGPACNAVAARFRRRALVVVFTDLVESVMTDALLPALAALTRTHLVMVAAVRDPDVARWARAAGVGAPSEAYRAAAAVAAIDGRDRVTARLAAAGAVVVDAEPGELAVRVVDAYLELKSTGRL